MRNSRILGDPTGTRRCRLQAGYHKHIKNTTLKAKVVRPERDHVRTHSFSCFVKIEDACALAFVLTYVCGVKSSA